MDWRLAILVAYVAVGSISAVLAIVMLPSLPPLQSVAIAGAAGGFGRCSWSLAGHVGRGDLDYKWVPWYAFTPLVGALIAIGLYCVTPLDVTETAVLAIGLAAGYWQCDTLDFIHRKFVAKIAPESAG